MSAIGRKTRKFDVVRLFIPEGFQILAGGKHSATTGKRTHAPTHPGGMQEGPDSGIPPGYVNSYQTTGGGTALTTGYCLKSLRDEGKNDFGSASILDRRFVDIEAQTQPLSPRS